jgi:hypothetical protein
MSYEIFSSLVPRRINHSQLLNGVDQLLQPVDGGLREIALLAQVCHLFSTISSNGLSGFAFCSSQIIKSVDISMMNH